MSEQEPKTNQLRSNFAALAENARPRPDCPEPERLWDALQGKLSTRARRKLIHHTADCPSCAEAWRLGSDLLETVPETRAEMEPSMPFRWQRWAPVSYALAAVFVFGILIVVSPWKDRADGVVRGGQTPQVVSLIDKNQTLSRQDCLLRWAPSSQKEGLRYQLWVTTAENLSQPLLQVLDLDQPEYRIEPERLLAVPSGAYLVWRVTLIMPDGARKTQTFSNRLD